MVGQTAATLSGETTALCRSPVHGARLTPDIPLYLPFTNREPEPGPNPNPDMSPNPLPKQARA